MDLQTQTCDVIAAGSGALPRRRNPAARCAPSSALTRRARRSMRSWRFAAAVFNNLVLFD